MNEVRKQPVLEYQSGTTRSRRRPDVLFGGLAMACFGLLVLLVTVAVFAMEHDLDLAALLFMLVIVLWPAGITLAILGLVFDRRRHWISTAALLANIFAPVILAVSAWLISRVTAWL